MPIGILIADDHAVVRDGLAALLEAQPDLTVLATTGNGREALRLVERLAPHIAILDISMPELDGLEATRRIVTHHPGTAVLILSMHSSAQHVLYALEAGAHGYLLKESAAREISDAVRAVHAGRRYLSTRVAEILAEGVSGRGGLNPLEQLSPREREILKLVADGHSSAGIGQLLHLSPKTVDSYRSRLMQKLQLADVVSLVKFAIQHGLTSLD